MGRVATHGAVAEDGQQAIAILADAAAGSTGGVAAHRDIAEGHRTASVRDAAAVCGGGVAAHCAVADGQSAGADAQCTAGVDAAATASGMVTDDRAAGEGQRANVADAAPGVEGGGEPVLNGDSGDRYGSR